MASYDRIILWLLLIIFIGFLIRIIGIGYGLPAVYHTDEPYLVKNALWMGAHHSLRPYFYTYPTLYSYLLLIVYGVFFVVGKISGIFRNSLDFGIQFIVNPTYFYLIGRFISVLFGTATGIVVYFIGKIGYGSRKVGLLSALFLMVLFTHKSHSQLVVPDVTMIFFSSLSLIFSLSIIKGGWKNYFIAGFFAGLAISTKYNCGFLVIAILVAHLVYHFGNREVGSTYWRILFDKNIWIAIFACIFAFLLGSPYWVLDFRGFWGELRNTSAHMQAGHLGETNGISWLWIFISIIQNEFLVGILLILGGIYAVIRHNKSDLVLLAFVISTFLYVGSWQKKGLDYLYPIFPILAVFASRFIFNFINQTNQLRKSTYLIIFLIIFFSLKDYFTSSSLRLICFSGVVSTAK